MKRKINISFVFENYPVFYQPYIPPVMEALAQHQALHVKINAFKGKNSMMVDVMPSYYRRRLIEKWHAFFSSSGVALHFNEIVALKQHIDIIHLQHSYLFPKVLGLLQLPKSKRPKIVITLRGGDTYVKPWISTKWRTFYKDFGNAVDAFVVMSLHQKNYLESWGIDEDRIHVIPISFGNRFEVAPKKADTQIITIVSVFRLCWEKNIEGNLKVIQHLKEKGLAVKYHIYGDGPDMGQLYFMVKKFDLQDVVTIHGKIENSKLKKIIAHYDFILQLSHSESFGVSVVEAQSHGIPAIVSNSCGLPETILPNKSGYCVAAHDAKKASEHIESLWKDAVLYRQFSEHAIQFSHQNFPVTKEVDRLVNLYTTLIVSSTKL
jgi:glycosyltransferase involved in cell wall biosynthesis